MLHDIIQKCVTIYILRVSLEEKYCSRLETSRLFYIFKRAVTHIYSNNFAKKQRSLVSLFL